jgi:hypothetical protein
VRGPRHFTVICINAICGWTGYRTADNLSQVIIDCCPRCRGPVVGKRS